MMINIDLIDKYIKLGFKLFTYESGKVKRIGNSPLIDSYITDSSELKNFDSEKTLLGLDLRKSNLNCVWVQLEDIIGIFSHDYVEEQQKLIELFSYSAPVYYDNELQAFYLLFKRFSDIDSKQKHLYAIASIQEGYVNIPFGISQSLNERSSWLFPERNIEKLNPFDIKHNQERTDHEPKTVNIDTNGICIDNPVEYYMLLSMLPVQIRRLLYI